MNINEFNIYIIGVGGQGIGLLSEVIHRAIDHAGMPCKGVDTHGLAQRGGTVTSHVRMGDQVFSPLIREGHADLVVALERHEALRGMNDYLKDQGTLIFYDAVWQPLNVRMKKAQQIDVSQIEETANNREIKLHNIFMEDLMDSRMQNVVLLANIAKNNLIPNVKSTHYIQALNDVLDPKILDKNVILFEKIIE